MKTIETSIQRQKFDASPQIPRTFKKSGTYIYRPAQFKETVMTIVNGSLETFKEAPMGSIIVRNFKVGNSVEHYIISGEKFAQRYDTVDGKEYFIEGNMWGLANAIGEIMAIQYNGEPFIFEAPWGEDMECQPGDFLGHPPEQEDDLYRIGQKEFNETYERI